MAKKQSFADKASKVKHTVTCPVCHSAQTPTLYIKSEQSPGGAWKFRQVHVNVCKCNQAEVMG